MGDVSRTHEPVRPEEGKIARTQSKSSQHPDPLPAHNPSGAGRILPYNVCVSDLIAVDPEVLGGTPVFKGTRVPVRTLFEYLEDNYTLEQFLEYFPTISKDHALRVLEESESALLGSKTA